MCELNECPYTAPWYADTEQGQDCNECIHWNDSIEWLELIER